jgi:hypothetical protein
VCVSMNKVRMFMSDLLVLCLPGLFGAELPTAVISWKYYLYTG